MNWETKFKPGDRVITKDGIGVIDTFAISTFLNHALDVDEKTITGMRKNDAGFYKFVYEVIQGESHNFYAEDDLILHDSSPYRGQIVNM
jgi:hypothetical protein